MWRGTVKKNTWSVHILTLSDHLACFVTVETPSESVLISHTFLSFDKDLHGQSSCDLYMAFKLLQNMASGHVKVKKGTGHVIYMATPSHATESVTVTYQSTVSVHSESVWNRISFIAGTQWLGERQLIFWYSVHPQAFFEESGGRQNKKIISKRHFNFWVGIRLIESVEKIILKKNRIFYIISF